MLPGCGTPSARVTGRVTCDGKPVVGVILFSPKPDETGNAAGSAVTAPLGEDGRFELKLTSMGAHTVVVTPHDVVARPKRGQFDYPCDRSPLERTVQPGDNEVTIELARRTR
jgi:hypothetical protein